jgi:hypothetical protein
MTVLTMQPGAQARRVCLHAFMGWEGGGGGLRKFMQQN